MKGFRVEEKRSEEKNLDSSRHADEIPNGLSEKTSADECGVLMSHKIRRNIIPLTKAPRSETDLVLQKRPNGFSLCEKTIPTERGIIMPQKMKD